MFAWPFYHLARWLSRHNRRFEFVYWGFYPWFSIHRYDQLPNVYRWGIRIGQLEVRRRWDDRVNNRGCSAR